MRARVRSTLAVLALLAGPVVGCSGDDPTGPAAGLSGLWVREELYVPFSGDGLVPTTIPDTLVLSPAGTGWWSYGRYDVESSPAPRARHAVTVERVAGGLMLEAETCDPMVETNCFFPTTSTSPTGQGAALVLRSSLVPPDGPRRTTTAPMHWRLRQQGDVLVLTFAWDAGQAMRFRRRVTGM